MGFRNTKSGIKSVCYLCEDRHPACHDTCQAYQMAKQEYEDKKEVIEKAKDEYAAYDSYKYDRVLSAIKRGRNKGKYYNP